MKKILLCIPVIVCVQFFLGIVTLINMVPVHLGALHQAVAIILFLAVIYSMHRNNLKINFI